VRLSSHVLAVDVTQFASQMIGRLLRYREQLPKFLDEISQTAPPVWLRPLHPPGTALVRTIADGTSCVAVTPDGKQAVSASYDNTLKVWDLESGGALCSLEGHSGYVLGLAVTPDGKRAVSASSDQTL
jgi:WD40 repeat protein